MSEIWTDRLHKESRAEHFTRIPAPVFRIEMRELPTLNNFLAIARHQGAAQGFVKKLRSAGAAACIKQAPKNRKEVTRWTEFGASEKGRETVIKHARITEPIEYPLILIVRYWRSTWLRFDVFSPAIKFVVDGFVDAGLVPDDDQTRIRETRTKFMGIDPELKLSDEARAAQKVKRIGRKTSLPTPSRYWFDFYPAGDFEK